MITHVFKKQHNDKKIMIAAPLYFGFLYPKLSSKYLPIRQLDNEECKKSINFNEKIDIILVDTQSLKEANNNNPQFKDLSKHIDKMKKMEQINIGRLATQNLNKEGYLYIYKLIEN